MPPKDNIILMGVGGLFIILGIIGILWGRHEENSYFTSMASRRDVREFVSHWPERPPLAAVKIGGWITVSLGLVMLIIGLILFVMAQRLL